MGRRPAENSALRRTDGMARQSSYIVVWLSL